MRLTGVPLAATTRPARAAHHAVHRQRPRDSLDPHVAPGQHVNPRGQVRGRAGPCVGAGARGPPTHGGPCYGVDLRVEADLRTMVDVWRGYLPIHTATSLEVMKLDGESKHARSFAKWFLLSPFAPFTPPVNVRSGERQAKRPARRKA
jgi:hypothetical protein